MKELVFFNKKVAPVLDRATREISKCKQKITKYTESRDSDNDRIESEKLAIGEIQRGACAEIRRWAGGARHMARLFATENASDGVTYVCDEHTTARLQAIKDAEEAAYKAIDALASTQ